MSRLISVAFNKCRNHHRLLGTKRESPALTVKQNVLFYSECIVEVYIPLSDETLRFSEHSGDYRLSVNT